MPQKKTPREWWIDETNDRDCGPWSEVREMDRARYDQVVHVVEHLAYQKLEKENAELRATLEFYASKEAWRPGIAFSQNNLLVESDMYCVKGDHFYGGKQARLFLYGTCDDVE